MNTLNDEQYIQFTTLALSVMNNFKEQAGALSAFFSFVATYRSYLIVSMTKEFSKECGCKEFRQDLDGIDENMFKFLTFMTLRNAIISTMTIFDSFLTDLTRFLFIQFPGAIPGDRKVRVREIFEFSDYSELTTNIINEYVFELSYKSITDRIAFLCQTFKIDTTNISENIQKLQDYSNLRNRLVHDASLFDYKAGNDQGKISISNRSENINLTNRIVAELYDLSNSIISSIYTETSRQIFHREPAVELNMSTLLDDYDMQKG